MQSVDEKEVQTFTHLKRFVRGLKHGDLKRFLRFTTGGNLICVPSINIAFNLLSGLSRGIVAHCCGNVLELPTSYECYGVFTEEFTNQLSSNHWEMDIV